MCQILNANGRKNYPKTRPTLFLTALPMSCPPMLPNPRFQPEAAILLVHLSLASRSLNTRSKKKGEYHQKPRRGEGYPRIREPYRICDVEDKREDDNREESGSRLSGTTERVS